jgi:predicted transposase/invertase (TIGR01784 family)
MNLTHDSAQPKLLNPLLDLVFKALFGMPGCEGLLTSLLNAVLRPLTPIDSIAILNPHMPKNLVDEKGIVVDIRAKLQDGSHIDIEMQAGKEPHLRKRSCYYLARTASAQLEVGDSYSKLSPSVVIFFMAQEYYKNKNQHYHLCERLREDLDLIPPSDLLVIHTIEIPKLFRHIKESSPECRQNLLEMWGNFLYDPLDQGLREDAMTDPIIKDAIKRLEELSGDEDMREIARLRENALRRYHTDLESALEEGEAKGWAKGKAEGENAAQLSILSKLLASPTTKHLSHQELAEMTGLSVMDVQKMAKGLP